MEGQTGLHGLQVPKSELRVHWLVSSNNGCHCRYILPGDNASEPTQQFRRVSSVVGRSSFSLYQIDVNVRSIAVSSHHQRFLEMTAFLPINSSRMLHRNILYAGSKYLRRSCQAIINSLLAVHPTFSNIIK